jgi:hypothetical protein
MHWWLNKNGGGLLWIWVTHYVWILGKCGIIRWIKPASRMVSRIIYGTTPQKISMEPGCMASTKKQAVSPAQNTRPQTRPKRLHFAIVAEIGTDAPKGAWA